MCKAVNTEPPLTCGGEKMVNILSRDWKDQENFEKPAVDMDETDCKISNKKKIIYNTVLSCVATSESKPKGFFHY